MLSLPFMYTPPPRRAESDSMNIQWSTIPWSPSHMMEPPLPPKYSSVAQSVAEGSVEYVSRSFDHLYSVIGSGTVTYNSYLALVLPS